MWVYWSTARLGKMVIQTEQKEGRYNLVAFAAPSEEVSLPSGSLLNGKVHVLANHPHKVAVGPSTDMQLFLNRIGLLQIYVETLPAGTEVKDDAFATWCLDRQKSIWVPDLSPKELPL